MMRELYSHIYSYKWKKKKKCDYHIRPSIDSTSFHGIQQTFVCAMLQINERKINLP